MTTPTIEALNQIFNSEDGARRAAVEQNRALQEQAALRLREQNALIGLRNRGAISDARGLSDSSREAAIRRANRAAEFAQQSEVLARQEGRILNRPGGIATDPTGSRMPDINRSGGAPAPTAPRLRIPGGSSLASQFAGMRGFVRGLGAEAGLGLLASGYGYLEPYNPVPRGYRAAMGDPLALANGINDLFQRELDSPGNLLRNLQRSFFGSPQMTPDPMNPAPSRSPAATSPFSGGQSPGVSYHVVARYTYGIGNPPQPFTQIYEFDAPGPISGVSAQSEGGSKSWYALTGGGPVLLLSASTEDDSASAGIVSVTRSDGQPDDGGDPAPVLDPNAPPRPALNSPNAPFAFPSPSPSPSPLAPAPSLGSPAPAPLAQPSPRVRPSPMPGGAPVEPTPGQNPANPNNQGRPHPGGNDLLSALIPAAIMAGALLVGERLANRSPAPQPTPGTGAGTGTGTTQPPTPFCRFHDDPFSPQINARTAEMRTIELAIQNYQQTMLQRLDEKLGPQIPGGGISGKLGKLGQMASKTWNFLQVDRVLAVISWIGILHNAFMLSNNIGQTLFSAIGASLDAIGIQKTDENGNEEPYDVGQIVGQWTDSYAKSIFGVDNWTNMKKEWKKLNRIYQSAANLLFSIQSITFSMTEMLEVISNYTGKIGNSLKRSGTILQNSFAWMNPSANYTNNRFFNALNNAQQTAEVIEQVSSNVVDIQQQGADLADRKSEFEKAMADQTKAVEDKEKASATASTRPNIPISPTDERKAEP